MKHYSSLLKTHYDYKLKNHNLLLRKEIIISIYVEDFCNTSLIELFTKKPEYILGHEV